MFDFPPLVKGYTIYFLLVIKSYVLKFLSICMSWFSVSFFQNMFKGCVRYILLVCFLGLKESTCDTRKNVFYFTSEALIVVEKIKF